MRCRFLILVLLLSAFLSVLVSSYGFTADAIESDDSAEAKRSFESEGYHKWPFTVTVGSEVSVDPYAVIVGTGLRVHRSTMFINLSPDFQLFIGTWSGFNPSSDPAQFVPESSGTLTTNSHQHPWLRYPPGASSGPVRGVILYN